MERSKVSGVEEAAESFCKASNPNISTVYLHDVDGSPPISKRPESSVVVVILLSVPHSADTVAPGIGCPPERTTPVCTSAAATPANTSKNRQVERSMNEILLINCETLRVLSAAQAQWNRQVKSEKVLSTSH
jgi:hypothetical protein